MLITAYNLALIILGFGLLIFVHELGHFLAARWANIRTEAFAVGMGPVMLAWRKGVGFAPGSTHKKVVAKTGKAARDLSDAELEKHGIGETEYSLRWLPIGGFVKMLGQEDANPNYVSDDPRSYNRCPIGKRMIVVSAGVIMNLILAAALFIVVFMTGVRFEAPVIGQVSSTLPAGTTMPEDAERLGITQPGLRAGDTVIEIDGKPARTFADIQIAAAMSRTDRPVRFTVERPGVEQPLHFSLQPEHDRSMGLLAIGVAPASSTQLMERDRRGDMERALSHAGLAQQGVEPGMTLLEANGRHMETFQQFDEIVAKSNGDPIHTIWSRLAATRSGAFPEEAPATIEAWVEVEPVLQPHLLTDVADDAQNFDLGLIGLSPLVKIASVVSESPNVGILYDGDVVLRVGDHVAPRMSQFHEIIKNHRGRTIDMEILRGGERLTIEARTERRGMFSDQRRLNVMVGAALDVPYFAEPIERVRAGANGDVRATPIAEHTLFPGSRVVAVNDVSVQNWSDFREALVTAIGDGQLALDLTVVHSFAHARLPIADSPLPSETVTITLAEDDVAAIDRLGWSSPLSAHLFEPVQTVRSAGAGLPGAGRALVMGVEETHKMVMLTYLTIDRLFRGTVGVEQLRGPIGIIDIGVTVADRGFLYLLFLLAVISVNLAVINFLPLPIVDGGLFLFLIYEKIKGRPPSIAFQNAATIAGLFLIGTLFLVVTYNDILRLVT